jgi:hypothetical protein
VKHACVLTTINVPNVLQLYRACDPAVRFFVVGDKKSDDIATRILIDTVPNSVYYSYDDQQQLGYGTNSMLPANCIQRRNIGFLEAVKWGAEIVTSIDDDNIPLDLSYFGDMNCRLQWPFNGVEISGKDGWFDVGQYLQPKSPHRGFPIQKKHNPVYRGVTKARIGVVAGVCMADPDISATTRIVSAPDVQQVAQLLEAGCVVAHDTRTVWNSQNTSVLRELLPAWGMIPFVQRYDDIFASLICKRIMRDRELHVHFGKPFVLQQRNQHDLVRDLKGEVDGMATAIKLADLLDQVILPNKSVAADCRIIWDAIKTSGLMPFEAISAMYAYLTDCEALS